MVKRFLLSLDSASAAEAAAAHELGFVGAVTTNPLLVAREGLRPLDALRRILDACDCPVFYQPTAPEMKDAATEIQEALELRPGRVIAKLPARADFFGLAARLAGGGIMCAATAVYSPGQALVAAAAGCSWVIPYVDRARRLRPEETDVVAQLSEVLRAVPERPAVLAASIKSVQQAVDAFRAGADAVTVPLPLLRELPEHPLTESAIEQFQAATRANVM
ncbi:MAG TPA: transaldolase family protein [Micromonosporaceae bacterium]|nr:transaldolase family protein [Micromonosporaceae bacterium]